MGYEFRPGNWPFKNRDALLDEYHPDELVGRDEELDRYHSALQPAINGSRPDNIFLYGKTGVGKTAGTRFLLDRLERSGQEYEISINTTRINCDGVDTSYRVAVEITNQLAAEGEKISETGHPRATVYEHMWTTLDRLGGTVIIVLDEVDHLQDDSILYQLSRARENGNLDNARVSVIGISNDLNYRSQLSPKVRSSLCEQSINFSAYDSSELRQVLRQRESIAFQDDVLDDEVIPLCAAYGARESGDARKALDLLLKAGDLAMREDADSVTEDHVQRGRNEIQQKEVTDGILGLNDHERYLLYAIVSFAAADETPVRSRALYGRYEQMADLAGRDSLTSRWMHDHLDDLDMLGLVGIAKRNEGPSGGQYKVISLEHDLPPVLEALEETIDEVGVYEPIRGVI